MTGIILLLTANGCGACEKFKNGINSDNSLLNELTKDGRYQVKHINFESTDGKLPSDIPHGVSKYVRQFPSIVVVNASDYSKNSSVIRGELMNIRTFSDFSAENILRFTSDVCKSWITGGGSSGGGGSAGQCSRTSIKFPIRKSQ